MPLSTWSDLSVADHRRAAARGCPVVIATGAIEQHGEHLPTGTDAFLAEKVVESAAHRSGLDVVVTPTVWLGCSATHRDFAGTISVGTSTYLSVLTDVVMSVARAGYSRILVVNGHGGNTGILRNLALELTADDIHIATADYFGLIVPELERVCTSAPGGVCHAGEMETSLMLHLAPQHVRMESAAADFGQPSGKYVGLDFRYPKPAFVAPDFPGLSDCGVSGDPTMATAEKGKELFEAAVSATAGLVDEWAQMGHDQC